MAFLLSLLLSLLLFGWFGLNMYRRFSYNIQISLFSSSDFGLILSFSFRPFAATISFCLLLLLLLLLLTSLLCHRHQCNRTKNELAMEVEEIQHQACKFPRMANGTGRSPGSSAKVVHKMGLNELHYPKDEDDAQQKRSSRAAGAMVAIGESTHLRGWHHHSRIVRVSRASGGKDRHSKVLTFRGLRDRRVRLSVPTAIQFYDIQDRLGYDQPSKAVEWLIKAAADSISELPSLNGYFGGSPTGQHLSDEKRTSEENATTDQNGFDSADVEMDGDNDPSSQYGQPNQNLSLSKSACSSTSENSKGSGGLSLSRSELRNNRVRARERARERTAKDKKESGSTQQQPLNLISQGSSFTELLTGGIGMSNGMNTTTASSSPSGSGHQNPSNSARQWSSAPMDYFGSGLLSSSLPRNSSGFVGQLQTANNQIAQVLPIPPFTISNGSDGSSQHHELPPHHFPFVPEGYIPTAAVASSIGGEYNLNFTISSSSGSPAAGLGGFNRGTLQSNTSSQVSFLSHLQRFSTIDGSSSPHHQNVNVPFFVGTAMPLDSSHHHHSQFPPFDGRLHLHYGHDEKEKPKN